MHKRKSSHCSHLHGFRFLLYSYAFINSPDSNKRLSCIVILLYHKKDIAIPPSFVKYSSDLIFRTSLRMLMLIFKNKKSWSWSWFGINCIEGGVFFMGDVIVLRLQQDDFVINNLFQAKTYMYTTFLLLLLFFFLEVKKRNNLDLFPIALKVSVNLSCQVIS